MALGPHHWPLIAPGPRYQAMIRSRVVTKDFEPSRSLTDPSPSSRIQAGPGLAPARPMGFKIGPEPNLAWSRFERRPSRGEARRIAMPTNNTRLDLVVGLVADQVKCPSGSPLQPSLQH
ncbi:hypothetical protein AMTR_s00002p00011970 [Amborella trichopoda]|uniref:Uncharacterized protein n=1 Tax=Amborella trichopoda TaxID=13333 RepID=W1NTP1_AMBTC|nr:hypothetical protein AMTR_s00002p00011970 [Amborella trichopoda]